MDHITNDVGVQLGDHTDPRAAIFLHTNLINQTKLDLRQHKRSLYMLTIDTGNGNEMTK